MECRLQYLKALVKKMSMVGIGEVGKLQADPFWEAAWRAAIQILLQMGIIAPQCL